MIRRTTPNKSFTHSKAESSCCKWCFTDQLQIQKQIIMGVKPTPTKMRARVSNKTSTAYNRERSEMIFLTPRTSVQPVRRQTFQMKQLYPTTIRMEYERRREVRVSLPTSQAAANPLQRMRNKSRREARRSQNGSKPAGAIIFNYQTPKNGQRSGGYLNLGLMMKKPEQLPRTRESEQILAIPEQLQMMKDSRSTLIKPGQYHGVRRSHLTLRQSEQLQMMKENELTMEVQMHRLEYQRLLQEYNQLRKQKETNAEVYRELLGKLKAQQSQVRELQRFRREQIKYLRAQIQQLIAKQGQVGGQ